MLQPNAGNIICLIEKDEDKIFEKSRRSVKPMFIFHTNVYVLTKLPQKNNNINTMFCILKIMYVNLFSFTFSFFLLEREAGVLEYCIKALNLPKCGFGLFLSQTFLGWLPVVEANWILMLIPVGNEVGVLFECCESNFPFTSLLEERLS